MAKFFRIPVTWTEHGHYHVKADTLEEAKSIVYDAELPEGEYLDDSFEIDNDGIQAFDTEGEVRKACLLDESVKILEE